MEQWYVLYTVPGREQTAMELLNRSINQEFFVCCRIPKKMKVFRSGGLLHIMESVMFPGYLFIKTSAPKVLVRELQKARKYPQFTGDTKEMITPVEEKDLHFLKDVCGEELQQTMGVTRVILSSRNQITQADGVLEHYRDHIIKLNLHKRYAVVEVELFNRTQEVLFGVSLECDQAV